MELSLQESKRSQLKIFKDKLDFFKKEYGDTATLFSLESSVDRKEAVDLYKNFDNFLSACKEQLDSTEVSNILNVIHEIIYYFNVAIDLLPSLSGKSGDLINMLHSFIGGGGGTGCTSYTIQFGLPAGISIAFSYPSET
jgi:hypothetical protein